MNHVDTSHDDAHADDADGLLCSDANEMNNGDNKPSAKPSFKEHQQDTPLTQTTTTTTAAADGEMAPAAPTTPLHLSKNPNDSSGSDSTMGRTHSSTGTRDAAAEQDISGTDLPSTPIQPTTPSNQPQEPDPNTNTNTNTLSEPPVHHSTRSLPSSPTTKRPHTAPLTPHTTLPLHLPFFTPATNCTNSSDYLVRCFVARLRSGITVVKHGRSRFCKSRLRVLTIHSDGRCLSWRPAEGEPRSGKKPPRLDLRKCVEVRHAWTVDRGAAALRSSTSGGSSTTPTG